MRQSRIAPQFGSRDKTFTVSSGEGLMISTKEYGTLFDAVAGYWYNIFNNVEMHNFKLFFVF